MPGSLRADLAGDALSDIEFCRVLHSLAAVTHFLVQGEPVTEDTVHRLVQLLARYCHGELGIPHRVNLRSHLLHAARGEPALHALKPYYRDHFFHVIEVALLGHVLLETQLPGGGFFWEEVARTLGCAGDKRRVLHLWYLAALLHDVGYALDVYKSSANHLKLFAHSTPLKELPDSAEQMIKALAEHADLKELKMPADPDECNHGIASALHVRSLLQRIQKEHDEVQADGYAPVVKAIALHDMRRRVDYIRYDDEPLAFLLAVCDQVQEWRRASLQHATAPSTLLAALGGDRVDAETHSGPLRGCHAECQRGGHDGRLSRRFRRRGRVPSAAPDQAGVRRRREP